jgi:hypothetical protein
VANSRVLRQVVDAARKAFCSSIPENRESTRNIPANCKTFPGTLPAIVNVLVGVWTVLVVTAVACIVVPLIITVIAESVR